VREGAWDGGVGVHVDAGKNSVRTSRIDCRSRKRRAHGDDQRSPRKVFAVLYTAIVWNMI
jgi:hypothetical protein